MATATDFSSLAKGTKIIITRYGGAKSRGNYQGIDGNDVLLDVPHTGVGNPTKVGIDGTVGYSAPGEVAYKREREPWTRSPPGKPTPNSRHGWRNGLKLGSSSSRNPEPTRTRAGISDLPRLENSGAALEAEPRPAAPKGILRCRWASVLYPETELTQNVR